MERKGRKTLQGALETRLAIERVRAGITQVELARVSGVPLTTYRRLERGEMSNPPIRYLTNIALTLDVDLLDICEDEWLQWTPLGEIDEAPLKEVMYDPDRWVFNLPPELLRDRNETDRRFESYVPVGRPPVAPLKIQYPIS